MINQEHRTDRGRRSSEERRRHNLSIIDNCLDYSGPERRGGQDRRTIIDRRK